MSIYRNNPIKYNFADGQVYIKKDYSFDDENGNIVEMNTGIYYFKNNLLHRDDGPAIIYDGGEEWWVNGLLHRNNAPAIIKKGGWFWYKHGKWHREDGPASKLNGRYVWALHDKEIIKDRIDKWVEENDIPHYSEWTNEHKILYVLKFSN